MDDLAARLSRRRPIARDKAALRRARLLEIGVCVAAFTQIAAARAADFYAGKTLTMIVASDAGGGYDVYGRLLAKYLPKYIPGAPRIVVQNEPGAGGLRAAQEIYSVVPKDGLTIGFLRGSNVLDSVLGIRGGDIDPTMFHWLGNMAGDTDLCTFGRAAGVHSLQDLQSKQILVGTSGAGSQGFIFPNLINHILHTKMKVVPGYKGVGDRLLALQQGELQGNCGMNASTITGLYSQLLARGDLIPIMQSGLRAYPALPDVPLTDSFVKDPDQRAILQTVSSQMEISRIFAAPPGTPSDRVHILRSAFDRSLKDEDLVADARRAKLDLSPSDGEAVAKIVLDMTRLSPASRKEARAALGE